MSTKGKAVPISFTANTWFSSAVVTGGGSGLGAMIATGLVQNGAKVYIASRKESQLKEVACSSNKMSCLCSS